MPATFVVTNPADSGASGTLRWAVEQADAATTPSTINFNLGSTPQTITLTQGQLELSNTAYSITIDGPGETQLDISGNDASRVFQVDSGVTANLSNLTISDGSTAEDGGGLYDLGTAILANSTVTGNTAFYGGGVYNPGGTTMTFTGVTLSDNYAYVGGGLENQGNATLANCTVSGNSVGNAGAGVSNSGNGTIMLTDCTVDGNSAYFNGGGVANYFGTATLADCTISGNSVGSFGGGIFNRIATITVTNTTLSDNVAGDGGGGLITEGGPSATLTNCTVSGNSTASFGGGVYVTSGGTLDIGDTIVATNTAATRGPDADGTVTSQGYNLIGKTDGSSGWIGSDLTGSIGDPLNPLLAPLGNYGGPTETVELLIGSPAIGAGVTVGGVTTDQRGIARPASKPDIGAFQTDLLTVTTKADSGAGSLRQAILDADASLGTSLISFNIGTSGSQQTITPASALPGVTVPILINGWSQGGTGYSGAPLVVLDGASAGLGAVGLVLGTESDGSIISALAINSFNEAGISIASTDNTVEGSYLGTNAAGTAAGSQSMAYGIIVTAADNTIGGAIAADFNVISGNTTNGVEITGTGATGDVVAGNDIGTNVAGAAALGNGIGVVIDAGASANTIGGIMGSTGNLISGNTAEGMDIYGTGTADNVVAGNFVGLNAAGSQALANGGDGISIYDSSSSNTIGGSTAGARNVVSGNGGDGISVAGVGTESNVIIGNYAGTNAAGTAAVGNANSGIRIVFGPSYTIVGGPVAADRNLTSGNGLSGITFDGTTSPGNVAEGNWVGLNAAGTGTIGNIAGIAFVDQVSEVTAVDNVVSGNQLGGFYIGTYLTSTGSSGNIVQGNLIGTDPTGTLALGNAGPGVLVFGGSADNTIGGTTSGAGNLISGGLSAGVSISGTGTSGNLLMGNYIGTNAAGTAAQGNSGDGVEITGGTTGNWIGVNPENGA